MSALIYVVDDHRASAEALGEALEDEGHAVRCFFEPSEALGCIRERVPDVLVTDLRMEGLDGIGLLKEARGVDDGLPVILVTAHATITRAIEATQAGAFAFVTKPVKLPEFMVQIRNAVSLRTLSRAVDDARGEGAIVGRSTPLLQAMGRADRAAATDMTVLITGESGTGKELFARRIHRRSDRRSKPFVAVNCGAIPDSLIEAELFGCVKGAFTGANSDRMGLLEGAHGGTLFLDEVGELSAEAQTRLLRFLQEGTIRRVGEIKDRVVDARVVAATHRDLTSEGFRDDLYYRLNVIPVELPPLRARGEDVLLLFGAALRRTCERLGRSVPDLSSEVISALKAYSWPGNVRELLNLADRLAVLSVADVVDLDDMPAAVAKAHLEPDTLTLPEGDFDLTGWLEGLEARALARAMRRFDGVKAHAAASLGLERNAFRYKLKKYGLAP